MDPNQVYSAAEVERMMKLKGPIAEGHGQKRMPCLGIRGGYAEIT